MPCLAIPFTPDIGPVFQLAIWKPGFQPSLPTAGSQNVNPIVLYAALADTGASCTCLTAKVIADVGLTPIGKQNVGGVHGQKLTNQYQFQVAILFPQNASPRNVVPLSLASALVKEMRPR